MRVGTGLATPLHDTALRLFATSALSAVLTNQTPRLAGSGGMALAGMAQLPDDLVAAIVLRAFRGSGATLQARLDMGLVCRHGAPQHGISLPQPHVMTLQAETLH